MRGGMELLRFTGGLVSRYLLARTDLRKLSVSASVFKNWFLRSVGYMFLRPGMKYLGGVGTGTIGRNIPFVKATDDTALIELSNITMRVRINDTLLAYPTVSTTVLNSSFGSGTDWTDVDEVGGVSTIGAGFLDMTSNGVALARREQAVTVALADQGVEHCIKIEVVRGPVGLQIGSTSGGAELFAQSQLGVGQHCIAFTPSGATFYIRFYSSLIRLVRVDSCASFTGAMTLTTPWNSQAALRSIIFDQSADVIFLACRNELNVPIHPRRIERRGTGRSWSLIAYAPEDGPFLVENVTPTTITASALTGNVTLTASRPVFNTSHEPALRGVGALFSLTSTGQTVSASITAENTFTNAIQVTGVGATRNFAIQITGTFVGTVHLQRSLDSDAGPWADVSGTGPWTAPVSTSLTDGLDNQIAWYRIGIKTGNYTSGTAEVRLTDSEGSIRGIARITAVASAISASAEVLAPLGSTTATDIWQEGEWSTYRGYPTAVKFHGLKLWWAGKGKAWGSISDAFESFDETFEGDAGAVNRSLTNGPVDKVSWIASMRRLIFGAQGAEVSAISSSLDEPLTPTNFDPRSTSNQGSAAVGAVTVDQGTFFVNRSGMKLFLLTPDQAGIDYVPSDMLKFAPEAGFPGIVAIAVQRQPETRVHCVRSDGLVLSMLLDSTEDVQSLAEIETDGTIIDVAILPARDGELDDQVYFTVTRNINGSNVTYVEKLALETECRGGVTNKTCDSFVYYSGAATTTITGLGHLEGEEVVVWGNGARISAGHGDEQITYTVSSAQITGLPVAVTTACVGKAYVADWRSTKLAYLAEPGKSALGARKKVGALGLVLADTSRSSIQYGPSFTELDPMPEIENYAVAADAIDDYEGDMIPFPRTDWTTDSRVCLRADSPGHAHALALTLDMDSNK